jgi:hypothetical protein
MRHRPVSPTSVCGPRAITRRDQPAVPAIGSYEAIKEGDEIAFA